MDMSKVIELGKVSEETKGFHPHILEVPDDMTSGPHTG
jgi:hypothetical protein